MKKAVILHGTDGKPTDQWIPWLKKELEASGYEVWAPLLPNNHTPNRKVYDDFLRNSNWDFSDNILIGHSSGSTTVLNLLLDKTFPKVKAAVLIGTFLNEKLLKQVDWYTPGQFDNLFLDSYDPSVLKQKTGSFYFVHGSNDPYCDIEDARALCREVDGKFIVIKDGHHLGGNSGVTELPQLTQALRAGNLL